MFNNDKRTLVLIQHKILSETTKAGKTHGVLLVKKGLWRIAYGVENCRHRLGGPPYMRYG